jgi:hypothetical protein
MAKRKQPTALERFEEALDTALTDLMTQSVMAHEAISTDTAKGEILTAVDQLMEESAVEMMEAGTLSLVLVLRGIYNSGQYTGKANSEQLDELCHLLAAAGRQANAERQRAQDQTAKSPN